MSERSVTQLPNGDLWRPPVSDENGNHVPRPDTFKLGPMPQRTMSPDVAAMLMADLERKNSAPAAE